MADPGDRRPLGRKLLWFLALWAGGVLTVTAIGYLIRLVLL